MRPGAVCPGRVQATGSELCSTQAIEFVPEIVTPQVKATMSMGKAKKGTDSRLKQAQRASMLLKHVSDPTRLQVILILSGGERHVGALSEHLNQSQPAVSHHLA